MEGSKDVDKAFPDALREPVLRKVQFSTISRIDNLGILTFSTALSLQANLFDSLVDHIFDEFKQDFYPSENVTVMLDNGERLNGVVRDKAKFPELMRRDGTCERKAFSRYFVRLTNRPHEEALVDDEHIVRDRKSFTKQMLRSFIKNTVTREAWTGAPWLVKDRIAKDYRIDTEIPLHLQYDNKVAERRTNQVQKKGEHEGILLNLLTTPRLPDLQPKSHKSKLTQQQIARNKHQQFLDYQQALADNPAFAANPGAFVNRETQFVNHFDSHFPKYQQIAAKGSPKPPPPPPIRYPIEDLEVAPTHDGTHRPAMKFLSQTLDNGEGRDNRCVSGIRMDSAGPLLETWDTLNVYAEIFNLDSFTFDDYVQALELTSEDLPCELFTEIHCAALKLLVEEESKGGKVQIMLPDLPEESDETEVANDTSTIPTPTPEPEPKPVGRTTRSSLSKLELAGVKTEPSPPMSTTPDVKIHRAAEMVSDYGWVDRLRKRDFRSGGWETIIIGLLHQLSLNPRRRKTCEELLSKLAPVDTKPDMATAQQHYSMLDINSRVQILQILCMLTIETKTVRAYMEECSEDMTGYRKEKIDFQRNRKIAMEELRVLDDERKILLPDNRPPSPEVVPVDDVSMAGMDEEEDEILDSDEEPHSGRSLRRANDRAADRKRKREEEKEKKEKAEAASKLPKQSAQFKKVLKEIEKKKERIRECEEEIATLDNDLRESDCPRTKVLGKDRFWNRYYWMERNGMPYAGLPTSSTAEAGYANGRLWVQGPDDMEREGFIDLPEDDNSKYRKAFQMTIPERKKLEEGSTSVITAHEWGYYDDSDSLDMLIGWLDVRGVRELKLRKELQMQRDKIVLHMQRRKEYLQNAEKRYVTDEHTTRMSTRTKTHDEPPAYRCMAWKNSTAIQELGHLHCEQPRPSRKVTKKEKADEKRETRGSKPGKPLGRQGSRYTF
ncbi:MAG: hypothetical protein M1827_006857 [Pycnora praestabilis]|nr:MAG: hypothetical protein M1827_006857 [Pycnora praestabilis]